jgi:hypothetical protein
MKWQETSNRLYDSYFWSETSPNRFLVIRIVNQEWESCKTRNRNGYKYWASLAEVDTSDIEKLKNARENWNQCDDVLALHQNGDYKEFSYYAGNNYRELIRYAKRYSSFRERMTAKH